MSAAAAALKKLAVFLITDKKMLKIIGGIVLGVIIIIVMPIVAVVSVFNGNIKLDTDRLQELVVANLSAEEMRRLQLVEDTMNSLDSEMKNSGFTTRTKEAQVLYVLALSEHADESDFVSKLVGCFSENQTDEQLIKKVNSVFGSDITADDFRKVMSRIRSVYIDTSGYTDVSTKNNLDLVEWAKQAKKSEWGYVWGTYGTVLTKEVYKSKAEQYPGEVGGYADFIENNWLGRRCADCVGLIKGYGWLNAETNQIEYCTNGMPDIGSDTMYKKAKEKGTIDTIPEIPGLAVWREGHIGIYIGDGQVIHSAGTKKGVIQTPIEQTGWTHWLKIPYINYVEKQNSGGKQYEKSNDNSNL